MRTDRWAWAAYLAFGLVVVVAYFVAVGADAPALVPVLLYSAVSTSSAVAVLYAVLFLYRPKPLLPWLMLGIGEAVYAAADISFYVSHHLLGNTSYPALADVFYLSHYPMVVVGLVSLIRLRTPGRDLPSLLDAALLAVVTGMLSWLFLMTPTAHTAAPTLAKVTSLAYPMMDLAMFAVALRLILGAGRRPAAFILLSTNLLAFFTADTIYVLQQLDGTYTAGNFLDAIWLTGNLALGAAALHPTMSRVGEPAAVADPGPGPARIAALCAAALVAPAMLLVEYARGDYSNIPVIAAACGLLFLLTIARLAVLVAQQRRLAITDVLTGLRTRRYFETKLALEVAHARKSSSPMAVLIADVDHFKSINDSHGHPGGDRVLIEIATRLRSGIRKEDVLSRYGGEEFAILIRGAAADDPMVIAERLRRKISDSPIMVDEARWVDVTISVGTATYPLHGTAPAELVTAADRALYAAKVHGRNRTDVDPGNAVTTAELAGTAGMIAYLQHVADVVDGWLSGHEHSRAVSRWAGLTALELGLTGEQVHHATLAGQLHDVGKILVPKEVWTKHTPLSEQDRQLVQRHPEHGYQMLRVVPGLSTAAEVVRQHHERVDGTGYPNHLKGEQIRIEARIVAVCDTWAELLADPTNTEEQAREELRRRRGTQLDPTVVDTFLALHNAGRLGNLSRLPTPTGSR